ncbi:glyoxalase/bleomycin resistance/extradiol dioxygenase family protein [Gracilibacillus oryzae]|uniref:Glyoxalase/bleomycin resistance/extradiol dioxygenase family protein n=1 Tax=Gracilibacillus oryzae TaxID=1672701 RepID=A0A7C8GQC4_9BACI|nr:VOC family protein [Gracilibacillus oryzae]KAB8125570.1 glyoxalase/bleomycin resistance/extradiol dioxygenase family protein [Gracilibacillus oryzae]
MNLQSFYPVIMSKDVELTSEFYQQHFDFTVTFKADWYISLKQNKTDYELAILDTNHQTIPKSFSNSIQGLILNFEVDDVDALYTRLIQQEKLPLELDIRDEEFGQRHFITSDPNGVLIDLITIIPPAPSFLKKYYEKIWENEQDG